MMVGIDFDNTIACYDAVYHAIVSDMKIVPTDTLANKTAIRDYLRLAGREDDWTELQGYIYGDGMRKAEPFPGVSEFISTCASLDIDICIISHRTREPYVGPKVDLHAKAREWLEQHGIISSREKGLTHSAAFFELTKSDKLLRITLQSCDWFVDDLPEFLMEPEFPSATRAVLFDPGSIHSQTSESNQMTVRTSWAGVQKLILAEDGQGE